MGRVASDSSVAGLRQAFGLCAALLLLVGCAQAGNQPAARATGGPPSLDWNTELVGGAILVTVADPDGFYRVEQVTLVGPAGQRINAEEITRRTYRESGSVAPSVSTGIGIGSGGRSGVGIGLNFPIIAGRSQKTPVSEIEARIRLPEQAADYRMEAGLWRITIAVTDKNGISSSADIPAPAGG